MAMSGAHQYNHSERYEFVRHGTVDKLEVVKKSSVTFAAINSLYKCTLADVRS